MADKIPSPLQRFIVSGPDYSGEYQGFCPFHDDEDPSASYNFRKRKWYCHAGCGGGGLQFLLERVELQDQADQQAGNRQVATFTSNVVPIRGKRDGGMQKHVDEAQVAGWHSHLLGNREARERLMRLRGLTLETLESYEIGYDSRLRAYTLPVRDTAGVLINVRRYQPAGDGGREGERSRYWSVAGMGERSLYPARVLAETSGDVLLCEGEWDALLANQHGFAAVTKTGGAGNWRADLSADFAGHNVYVLYDADEVGAKGRELAARSLGEVAQQVYQVHLPYPVTANHGKDLTDYLRDHTADDLRQLLAEALPQLPPDLPDAGDPLPVSVLGSFSAELSGKPLEMVATITGKRNPPYHIAKRFVYSCTLDAGAKCNVCPMQAHDGYREEFVDPRDPVVLEMLDAPKDQQHDLRRRQVGAVKCTKAKSEVTAYQAVEELFVRPSVEVVDENSEGDYTNRKLYSIGRHDTPVNRTVRVVGSILPNPRTQRSEFLAWRVDQTESAIDRFEITDVAVKLMRLFKPRRGQSALSKLREIAEDLATNVTHITGRPLLHMAMDVVWHSVLDFSFGGQRVGKGWVELLVVGDTRTGKSAAAETLIRHYGAGRIVSCESASFAGIVGGLQQYGAGKEWTITWGAVPLNDRRLVVLDEISGLSPEQIAQMSSIRSSGIAQLTKIEAQQTTARTRLIWLGNPRGGALHHYTYGVHALQPLIGNPEDIARFDLAMSVASDDVSSATINVQRTNAVDHVYSAEACHTLLQWVWSRKADHVHWTAGAEQAVYASAVRLGERYVEEPPLVQSANVRMKVARVAVAIAARTFSTDASHQLVMVKKRHVHDAVRFMQALYGQASFGYAAISAEQIADRKSAVAAMDDVQQYLYSHKGLAKFLRGMPGGFRRQDMEEMLNRSREEANAIINKLWQYRMLRKYPDGTIGLMPALHQLLRESR